MRILLDTSILVRISHTDSAQFPATSDAVDRLLDSVHAVCIVPQVLYEYWVVVTRPQSANGLGFTTTQAAQDFDGFIKQYTLLNDESEVFENWQALVRRHQVLGKNAHDTRLVAAMQRHAIPAILTLNARDFGRYPGIVVYTPKSLPQNLEDLDGS